MLRDFAWNAFEMTGNPDIYVFYKEVSNIKKNEEKEPENGLSDTNAMQG